MLKNLFQTDEIVKATEKDGASLQKMEKIEKKEMLEKDLPIDPKAVFNNYKKGKQDKVAVTTSSTYIKSLESSPSPHTSKGNLFSQNFLTIAGSTCDVSRLNLSYGP